MNESGTKLLCNLDVYTHIISMFEMFSDEKYDKSDIIPQIILVKDSLGSEFCEFIKDEIFNMFSVLELNWDNSEYEKQLEYLSKSINQLDSEESEQKASVSVGSVPQKQIIYLNNPDFDSVEEKLKVIHLVKRIREMLKQNPDYFFLLRIIHNDIPQEIIEYLDIVFTIPYPTKIQRIEIFERLLENLAIHTVDITYLSELTEDSWNVNDLKRLVDIAFIQWKILNYTEFKAQLEREKDEEQVEQETEPSSDSNRTLLTKIPLTGEIFAELIKNNQIRPLSSYNSYKDFTNSKIPQVGKNDRETHPLNDGSFQSNSVTSFKGLGLAELDSFTSSQLYQYAAATKFEELTLILEKIDQARKLDDLDRTILADYAFILKDAPNRALLKLTNAKKTIDRIQKIAER
ncbi:MAG: hypothetical protein JW776_14980 [Candidatus Lokiarchaeota archaeon]|nr:hypothetical protein [Candidatus Lokiarchaeota archaeon]